MVWHWHAHTDFTEIYSIAWISIVICFRYILVRNFYRIAVKSCLLNSVYKIVIRILISKNFAAGKKSGVRKDQNSGNKKSGNFKESSSFESNK